MTIAPRSKEFRERIVAAISAAEKDTSGEIRLHIQNRVKGDILEVAKKRFEKMGMTATELRNGVLFFMAAQDEVGIRGSRLRTCTGSDVRQLFERLAAFAGVVDEHETAFQAIGEGVDVVVQVGHCAVVVLVGADRQKAVEGIQDHDLEAARLELLEIGSETM